MHIRGLNLFLLLAVPGMAAQAQDIPVFRSNVDLIFVDAQVLSQGKPVRGLKQQDFLLWDNGKPQTIASFGADDQPLDVMLLLDISGSMVPIEQKVKNIAAEAMANLLPGDRVGIAVFSHRARLIVAPSSDRQKVDTAVRKISWVGTGTELNATVLSTAKYLGNHGRLEARRAVVILTDNKGYRSMPDEWVRDGLWENNVVMNALLFPKTPGESGDADVRRFVKSTGGESIVVRSADIPLAEMFRRLRERYGIMYHAPGGEPGSMRTIHVELAPHAKSKLKDVKIRARAGYRVVAAGSAVVLSP
jgi:VWFA-related protein